jgi:Acetyltransferase (GNAT) domain
MLNAKIIEHQFLNAKDLLAICEIKSAVWSYSIEKQKQWIEQNIKFNDLHFLLFESGELIAYSNLIKIEVVIDGSILEAYGIGNVCSINKGKGHGGLLMSVLGQYLNENNVIGILFCKCSLIGFYLKHSWILVDKLKINLFFKAPIDFNVMCYNLNFNFSTLEYKGRTF